jgi:hypothetical protein
MGKFIFRAALGTLLVLFFGEIHPGYGLDILMLKAGASHTAALRSDGTVWT